MKRTPCILIYDLVTHFYMVILSIYNIRISICLIIERVYIRA